MKPLSQQVESALEFDRATTYATAASLFVSAADKPAFSEGAQTERLRTEKLDAALVSLVAYVESTLTRCHTGSLLVEPCVSANHDYSHENFVNSEQGKREMKAYEALASVRAAIGESNGN